MIHGGMVVWMWKMRDYRIMKFFIDLCLSLQDHAHSVVYMVWYLIENEIEIANVRDSKLS